MTELSLHIGWRFWRGRNNNGFVSFISVSSVVGITLGVAVLIIVLSAMNGFERELRERLLAVVPHGEFLAVEGALQDWPRLQQALEQEPEVIAAAPFIALQGLMQRGETMKPVTLRGIEPSLEQRTSNVAEFIDEAGWASLDNAANQVVLGAALANSLEAKIGDRVSLLIPAADPRQSPVQRVLTVSGLFKLGGEIDSAMAYTNMQTAADIAGLTGPNGMRFSVQDLFAAPAVIHRVGFAQNEALYLQDWTRTQGHLYSDIQLIRMLTYLVLVLVVAVASFNIICSLVMAVRDKQHEIAILRTMGMAQTGIIVTFLVQGAVTGAVGCLFGAISGALLAWQLPNLVLWVEQLAGIQVLSGDVYFIDFLPSELHFSDVVSVVLVAFLVTLLATLYPAWQASRLQPAQVL